MVLIALVALTVYKRGTVDAREGEILAIDIAGEKHYIPEDIEMFSHRDS